MIKIGVFGGAFNPIHNGHVNMVKEAFTDLKLQKMLIINFYAVILTVSDKRLAKKEGARRVPEKSLFLAAALGGSLGMYLTMKKIRHKTKHKRFMIGIPVIIVLQLAAVFAVWYFLLQK